MHAGNESGLTMKEVTLTPGQEILVDKSSHQFLVKNVITDKQIIAGQTNPGGAEDRGCIGFSRKSPLDMVFRKIGIHYRVPVSFRPDEMEGLYFTGTFLKSDDLKLILSTICHVNDLQFTKEQDSIVITKLH